MGSGQTTKCGGGVALHSEGVDRNLSTALALPHFALVALHPEGVDRNVCVEVCVSVSLSSPST